MAFNSESGKEAGKNSSRKGISNKKTAKIRDKIVLILENNISDLESDLNSLRPKERLEILLKLMTFVLPKVKATEVDQLQGFDEMESKLVAAMEHDKERRQILMKKIEEAKKDRDKRNSIN